MPVVFEADGAGWKRLAERQAIAAIGLKADGLFNIPPAWRPDFVVLTHGLLASLVGARTSPSRPLKSLCAEVVDALGRPAKLIVRSSATDETLENRGRYESYVISRSVERLAQSIVRAWSDAIANGLDQAGSGPPLVIQGYLAPQAKGHLSNEFRHAQRPVDFLFEAEECEQRFALDPRDPYSFKLKRPVRPPRPLPLTLGRFSNIGAALEHVAQWIVPNLERGHVEWVVSDDRLWLVQFDPERPPSKIKPLGAWLEDASRRFTGHLHAFRTLSRNETASAWRKTQSHHVFAEAGLSVPPIYLLDDETSLQSAFDGVLTSQLASDLAALVQIPTIFRIDVESSLSEWTNLPVHGPESDPAKARTAIVEAVQKTVQKGATVNQLCVVAHHFVPAKAAAWATAHPGKSEVKIDAIWGLPDGLQAFPYDTAIANLDTREALITVRYKDKFLDVDTDGKWVTRSTPPALAREQVLTQELALRVASDTHAVASSRGKATRVMWFLQTDERAGLGPAIPWILQDEEEEESFWLDAVDAQSRDGVDVDRIQKRIKLGTVRRIETENDLAAFKQNPGLFDAGGNCVLFRPAISLLRNKAFIRELAEHIATMSGWYLVLEGSLLAHAPYQLRNLGVHRIISIWEFARPPRQVRIGKLVRDKIPDAIRARGETAAAVELEPSTIDRALRSKLVEEALEVFRASGTNSLAEELADVLTVMHSLARRWEISWRDVEQMERAKKRKRGGFDKALFLSATGQPTGRPAAESQRIGIPQPARRLRHKVGVALSLVPPIFPPPDEPRFRFQFGDTNVYVTVEYQDREVLLTLDTKADSESLNQLELFSDVPARATPRNKPR